MLQAGIMMHVSAWMRRCYCNRLDTAGQHFSRSKLQARSCLQAAVRTYVFFHSSSVWADRGQVFFNSGFHRRCRPGSSASELQVLRQAEVILLTVVTAAVQFDRASCAGTSPLQAGGPPQARSSCITDLSQVQHQHHSETSLGATQKGCLHACKQAGGLIS